jgi:hypothetical protein
MKFTKKLIDPLKMLQYCCFCADHSRKTIMFCTFEELWGPATAEQRHWEQLFWVRK